MSDKQRLTANTEIRHLRSRDRSHLCSILDTGDHWKELAAVIVKPDGEDGLLLSTSNIRTLEQQKYVPNGSPTQSLLDYWGTKGRKRPVIRDLIDYLERCNLRLAANYVVVNVLKENYNGIKDDQDSEAVANGSHNSSLDNNCISLKREEHEENILSSRPSPTAPNLSTLSIEENSVYNDVSDILLNHSEIHRFSFAEISKATRNFAEISVKEGGCKIGEGAFGSVFVARLSPNEVFAVKRLKNDFHNQFVNEMKILTKFKHENLLPLLGIAFEGSILCLLYEFMVNGSLFDRIACVDNSDPISWQERLYITCKVCDGICHLHTFDETPYIHRDIKSANILLDKHLTPKIGDFGLARIGSQAVSDVTKTGAKTTNIIGTSVYMAPEAFRGDISVKLDTFSFGVVMLELITGLSPFDPDRDEPDVLSFVEERILGEVDEDEINEEHLQQYLDSKAGLWDISVALKYFKLSRRATEQRKKSRPTMLQLKELINTLLQPFFIK